MDRDYDLFEILPNGDILWHEMVTGVENAIAKLKELGTRSPNECFAIHTPTKDVIARINAPRHPE